MKRIPLLVFSSILLALVAGACSEEPDFPTAPVYGTLMISNQTPNGIQVIRYRVSSTDADIWGRDVVKSNEAYIQGNSAVLRMPPGTFDFRFESNDVNEFWTYTGVVITAGQDTYLTIR
jgi:hypothetical protein